ncbi:hypothetical protein DCC81_03835 [Chitinophaga parva]|uniref:Uncharacterized protein n=1 Tax=Chitinophaga parva TaxID=2169414 RepID=A0A2T7BLR6_9BACT|nr:hypothetical protein [Chitinophaga parva]PUZ28624.1 hypothetical protein DCC81_03835 [Chitinophaga parva]
MKIVVWAIGLIFLIIVFYEVATIPPATMTMEVKNMPLTTFLDSAKTYLQFTWYASDDSVVKRFLPLTLHLKNTNLNDLVDSLKAKEPLVNFSVQRVGAYNCFIEISAALK